MPRPLASPATPAGPRIEKAAELGAAVRAQRATLGLRIDDAAALAGISVGALSRLENGAGSLSSAKLLKLLDALGLAMFVVQKGARTPGS